MAPTNERVQHGNQTAEAAALSLSKTYLEASFRAVHLAQLLVTHVLYHFGPEEGGEDADEDSRYQGRTSEHARRCLVSRLDDPKRN